MIHVGVIGLGMMGNTHLGVYAGRDDCRVVAVADVDEARLSGASRAGGNIEGQAKGPAFPPDTKCYRDGLALLADPRVQLVDICLPTPLHLRFTEAALEAGKHVLVEKPLARDYPQARRMTELAKAAETIVMPAMCMRFWPGWDWLRQVIRDGTYGTVRSLQIRRVTSHPGGPFYSDGAQCGGALLDLHIHDTDFVQWCFGVPAAVESRGYTGPSGHTDHVFTHYFYEGEGAPAVVTAEGGWAFADGFGFEMQYTANFEHATAVFDLAGDPVLRLIRDGKSTAIELPDGMGYEHEIAYLLDCIRSNRKPQTITVPDAAQSVRIAEAEQRSVDSGQRQQVT